MEEFIGKVFSWAFRETPPGFTQKIASEFFFRNFYGLHEKFNHFLKYLPRISSGIALEFPSKIPLDVSPQFQKCFRGYLRNSPRDYSRNVFEILLVENLPWILPPKLLHGCFFFQSLHISFG